MLTVSQRRRHLDSCKDAHGRALSNLSTAIHLYIKDLVLQEMQKDPMIKSFSMAMGSASTTWFDQDEWLDDDTPKRRWDEGIPAVDAFFEEIDGWAVVQDMIGYKAWPLRYWRTEIGGPINYTTDW